MSLRQYFKPLLRYARFISGSNLLIFKVDKRNIKLSIFMNGRRVWVRACTFVYADYCSRDMLSMWLIRCQTLMFGMDQIHIWVRTWCTYSQLWQTCRMRTFGLYTLSMTRNLSGIPPCFGGSLPQCILATIRPKSSTLYVLLLSQPD